MAYTKQTWSCGDEITAEKLNHIEDGIENAGGGGTLVLHETGKDENDCIVYDKTWKEVDDALRSGQRVVAVTTTSNGNRDLVGTIEILSSNKDQMVGTHAYGVFIDPLDSSLATADFSSTDETSYLTYCSIS